jgi:DNA-directed RNA polymerase specialized sigma subunit
VIEGERAPAKRVPLSPEQRALVVDHAPLVPPSGRHIKRIWRTAVPLDDLVGYGLEGISLAALVFDEGRGVPFSIFGLFRASGAMLRAIQKEARHGALCEAIRRVGMEWLGDQEDTPHVTGLVMDPEDEIRRKARAFLAVAAVAVVVDVVIQTNTEANIGADEAMASRAATALARRALRESIRDLPDHLQKVMDAVHGRRLTLKDAAAEAGIPYPTYKRRYREALERLAVAMRARGIRRAPPVVD